MTLTRLQKFNLHDPLLCFHPHCATHAATLFCPLGWANGRQIVAAENSPGGVTEESVVSSALVPKMGCSARYDLVGLVCYSEGFVPFLSRAADTAVTPLDPSRLILHDREETKDK